MADTIKQPVDQDNTLPEDAHKSPGSEEDRAGSNFYLQLANQELNIPVNHWTFLIVLVLVLALFGIEVLSDKPGSLTQSVVYGIFDLNPETKNVDVTGKSGSIYEFWTPSTDTPDSFNPRTAWANMSDEKKRWYRLDEGEKTLRTFGESLLNLGATGYSYVESYGQGTNVLKKGLIWEVTFPRDSAMTPASFIRLYNKYFHRDKNIYLKISGADATRASRDTRGDIRWSHKALSSEN